MGELSILEYGVYALIAYSSLLMLIISTIKEIPDTKAGSISRVIYLVPGAITALILAFSGVNIDTSNIHNTITNLNTTDTWTETISSSIVLVNPIWISVHFMIFAVILIHVFQQVFTFLTKNE